ncbi:serine/threonine-protein kinase [Nocardia acidivorans]|uniref:serine/threonine-protein kinase n=1 Tax=Nocardia acidivorans TaxID=404580 RepID=UPI0008366748|nr:serine/threonine-protein kinase [Nocardia acidivorans]
MTSPHHPLTVGSRFGPYRLDRLIGRGGMGEVYQGYDTVKDRTVAIKVLPARLAQDPVYRQRFQRESHAAARLREAHVIPIHDYGEIDGHLFIDMRLVDGESLRELLRRSGSLTAERTVEIVGQVAAALDAAHADGLLHRDVKPDNILITHAGFAYLVDFGIAQSATDSTLTGDGSAVGSYGYMAPERFASRELTPAADVYALACVLFECLTGTRPFIGDTDPQIMRAHLFDPVPRPSQVRPTVSAAFDTVVARGMAKNPAKRTASAGALAAAARAALTTPAEAGELTLDDQTQTAAPVQDSPVQDSTDEPTAVSDVPDDTGPATPPGGPEPHAVTGSEAARHRGGPRRIAALAAVIALVAALGFMGWALARPFRAGHPIPDASALTKDDVDLLAFTQRPAFNRANCVHEDPDEYSIAILSCGIDYDAGNPGVRLWRFRDADKLHEYYTSVLDVTQLTACPGDPPGQDAPSTRDGKEVGRRACYTNTTIGPAPKPAFIVTNEEIPAMAMYLWDDVADQPIRDWEALREDWQFRAADNARDPDDFSPADRAIFANVGQEWQAGNCRHAELPSGSAANASVECVNANGYPLSAFIGFADRTKATLLYQQDLTLLKGHACGGGDQPDSVWRQKGTLVGRFYCYADPSEPGRQCILSLPDEFHTAGIFCTLPPDDPHLGPKDEQQLLEWFLRKLG